MALPCARAWARRRRALAAALALALAATLSGCQSNPEPPPLDRAATSSSPAPSPGLTAPTLPPEARGTSKAAAKAFVRHYVATVNYAMVTGETQALSQLNSSRCSTCKAITNRIDEIYSAGGHLHGSGWKIVTIAHLSGGRVSPVLSTGIEIAPQIAQFRRGGAAKRSARSRGNLSFWLTRRGAHWKVEKLEATQ